MNGTQRIALIARLEDAIEHYNATVYCHNQYQTTKTEILYEKAIAVLTEVNQIANIFLNITLVFDDDFDDDDYKHRPINQFIIDDVHYYV